MSVGLTVLSIWLVALPLVFCLLVAVYPRFLRWRVNARRALDGARAPHLRGARSRFRPGVY